MKITHLRTKVSFILIPGSLFMGILLNVLSTYLLLPVHQRIEYDKALNNAVQVTDALNGRVAMSYQSRCMKDLKAEIATLNRNLEDGTG